MKTFISVFLFFRYSFLHFVNYKEDIEELANLFLERFSLKLGKHIDAINGKVLSALQKGEWEGNVRELRNVIERSAIICDGQIRLENLPIEFQGHLCSDTNGADEFELAAIERETHHESIAIYAW